MTVLRHKRSFGILIALAVAASLFAAAATGQAATPSDGLVCTDGQVDDSGPIVQRTFDLEAEAGYIDTPDGNSVFMWSFQISGGSFQSPGPVLCVNEGDEVVVNLTNNLAEAVSIVFPGQSGVTSDDPTPGLLAGEADPSGGTVSYTFVADEPGTYLYESGTNTHEQIQMGLYGGLIVRPSMGDTYAYNDPATEFQPGREFFLIMAEIDPDLHHAVDVGGTYDVTTRHDRYWTINGRSSPDTVAGNDVLWLPNQPYGALVRIEAGSPLPAMIRYANAGTVNHPFHPHGNTMTVVGRDGRPLGGAAFENFTSTIGAGQTYDLLFRWDNVEGWDPAGPNIPENSRFPFPNLGNLVFKDDVTWYSGDEYLGVQGDLPPGVTSFNQCGEFYFPWHSHALHEVQNWNEGFGGMLTLVRVDPPGGCS